MISIKKFILEAITDNHTSTTLLTIRSPTQPESQRLLLITSNHSSIATSTSLSINLNDDQQQQQQHQPLKAVEGNKMKEILREERLKIIKQRREQEQLKRKEELEESLKRKQELREKQLKERQKKIDELKHLEAEKRAAVIERKKQKEETIQVNTKKLIFC